jgi:hypothetical protein
MEDNEGNRKYENVSHFVRCAIMRLIRTERPYIKRSRGRPGKYIGTGKDTYTGDMQVGGDTVERSDEVGGVGQS